MKKYFGSITFLATITIMVLTGCSPSESIDKVNLQSIDQEERKSVDTAEEESEDKYDSKFDFCSKKLLYGSDGKLLECIEYDDLGNISKETKYSPDGSGNINYFREYFYQYDSMGNKEATVFDLEGEVSATINYVFDTDGNEIKTMYHYRYFESSCCFDYDEIGNKIKETKFQDSEEVYWFKWEYDSLNNVIRQTDSYGNTMEYEYEYDEAGNRIKQIDYYIDNDTKIIRFITEYQYDKSGNVIKETLYTPEAKLLQWTEYEYEK